VGFFELANGQHGRGSRQVNGRGIKRGARSVFGRS
jgi:hypothetical protein